MKIELHLLQNFPPSNLNRDDSGAPKDCEFGGYRRARVSSQCFKRASRRYFQTGIRTKHLITQIAQYLLQNDEIADEEAKGISRVFVQWLLPGKDGTKKVRNKKIENNETSYLTFFGPEEIEDVGKALDAMLPQLLPLIRNELATQQEVESAANKDEAKDALTKLTSAREALDKVIRKHADEFKDRHKGRVRALDIALFGRMLADSPEINIDASVQVAHALSTNRIAQDFDYFTAIDDFPQEGDSGADMIGTVPFNSACYYRYTCVDAQMLAENLGGKKTPDRGAAREGVGAFLRAFIQAVPSGKQNSFSAQMRPSLVMAVVRPESQPLSLANAFEKPARPDGETSLTAASVARLAQHWAALKKMYPDDAYGYFALLDGTGDPTALTATRLEDVASADAVVNRVLNDLDRWQVGEAKV